MMQPRYLRFKERLQQHKMGKYSWVRYMRRNTINLNKDNQVAILGPTGGGKSYSSICIALMVMHDWHESEITNPTPEMIKLMLDFVDNNVMFDHEEIFSVVKNKHNINTSFVVEEIGVNMDATMWQSKVNRLMKHMGQTIRHRRYNMFYTVPNLSSSAKQNRILMPIIFKTIYIDRVLKKCFINPRFYPVDSMSGELMSKTGYPLIVEGDAINQWGVPLLPDEVIERYEARKLAFTEKLYATMGETGEDEAIKKRPTHFCPHCKRVWKAKVASPKTCTFCSSKKEEHVPQPIQYRLVHNSLS